MTTLAAGKTAPQISLEDLQGRPFALADQLKRGPLLLAFFKISCPVCQYTFPYLQRLYQNLGGMANIVGISQNSRTETARFAREFGITFPIVLDEEDRYAASNAYGLTNVPTLFLISPDGEIQISSVGWSRADVEEIAAQLARGLRQDSPAVFNPGEYVEAYKAG